MSMSPDQLATTLEELATRVRHQSPVEANVRREFHSVEVPSGTMFVEREATGGETVRIEIVWT